MEKIALPAYVGVLRPTSAAAEITALYARLVAKAVRAHQVGNEAELQDIVEALERLPLPPFALLMPQLNALLDREEAVAKRRETLRAVLAQVIAHRPFDESRYLAAYPDVARAAAADPQFTAQRHYVLHGYFEGRFPGVADPIFR